MCVYVMVKSMILPYYCLKQQPRGRQPIRSKNPPVVAPRRQPAQGGRARGRASEPSRDSSEQGLDERPTPRTDNGELSPTESEVGYFVCINSVNSQTCRLSRFPVKKPQKPRHQN